MLRERVERSCSPHSDKSLNIRSAVLLCFSSFSFEMMLKYDKKNGYRLQKEELVRAECWSWREQL